MQLGAISLPTNYPIFGYEFKKQSVFGSKSDSQKFSLLLSSYAPKAACLSVDRGRVAGRTGAPTPYIMDEPQPKYTKYLTLIKVQ